MSITPETIKTLDDQVREIGKFLEMEFDQEEKAKRGEWSLNYWAGLKTGSKRISFQTGDYKLRGRFEIRAVFPQDKKGQIQSGGYNVKTPEITVAIDRGAEKIARAIQSRLLPEYEKQLITVLENIERSNNYHAGRLQILKTVAEYFGQVAPEDDDKPIYPYSGWGIYKIESTSDGVKFEVSASVQIALKIFELLKVKGKKDENE